jgi:hypothetical protein
MQEMIELSKQQAQIQETPLKLVKFNVGDKATYLMAGPAQFGVQLDAGFAVGNSNASDFNICFNRKMLLFF